MNINELPTPGGRVLRPWRNLARWRAALLRSMSFLRGTGVLVIAASCGATESGQPGDPAATVAGRTLDSMTLVPGVVVEPERAALYIMRPGGGIEALDVDNGNLRWRSNQADEPLFVAGDKLLAKIDAIVAGLAVAFLDPDSGKRTENNGEPLVLSLPAGVTAGIDQTLERSFSQAVRESTGEIYLTWDFLYRPVTGAAPPGGRSPEQRERGAFRFLGDTFEIIPPESISSDTEAWPPEITELFESRQIRRPPSRTGSVFAIAEQRHNPDQLVLRRWRESDGKPLQEKVLYTGRALAVLASCDERQVVVAAPNVRNASETPYVLRYYDLNSGDLITELLSTRSVGPFCVVDSRLLGLSQPERRRVNGVMVEKALEVVAVDVESGEEAWRRAIRDTAFRGLAPPAN